MISEKLEKRGEREDDKLGMGHGILHSRYIFFVFLINLSLKRHFKL